MNHFLYILAWVFAILSSISVVWQITWFSGLTKLEQYYATLSKAPLLICIVSWVYVFAGPSY